LVGVSTGSGTVGSSVVVGAVGFGFGVLDVVVVGLLSSGMSGTSRGSTLRSELPLSLGTDRLPFSFGISTAFLL
jgi:hypothetical protein